MTRVEEIEAAAYDFVREYAKWEDLCIRTECAIINRKNCHIMVVGSLMTVLAKSNILPIHDDKPT